MEAHLLLRCHTNARDRNLLSTQRAILHPCQGSATTQALLFVKTPSWVHLVLTRVLPRRSTPTHTLVHLQISSFTLAHPQTFRKIFGRITNQISSSHQILLVSSLQKALCNNRLW